MIFPDNLHCAVLTATREALCFVLLDDHGASPEHPSSRLYTGYVRSIGQGNDTNATALAMPAMLAEMTLALQQGLHAVGLFSYEACANLHGITPRNEQADFATFANRSQILLFQHCEKLSAEQVSAWLIDSEPSSVLRESSTWSAEDPASIDLAGIAQLRASADEATFNAAISSIHSYIEAGDVYQINYTYRLQFEVYGAPKALYRRLRARQPVPYGALIALPDGRTVLSLSPELLLSHTRGQIVARPMKGTAPATGRDADDVLHARALAADIKNRAENVMITDLLRNDLGKIAQIGSVMVPSLFDVARHGKVLQMTSTVQAKLRDNISLADVLSSVLPCGSITGAPKRRAMEVIREIELSARGLYTGAIGWFEAPLPTPQSQSETQMQAQTPGDFCLSVPIRTLVLEAPSTQGIRVGEMGIGAGIVHDSQAADEYAECLLKASFLTGMSHAFELFETMHASHDGCRHRDLHLARMRTSAAYFGFDFDLKKIILALDSSCAAMSPDRPFRLRLALKPSGDIAIQKAPLQALSSYDQGHVGVLLASLPTRAFDPFLRHKTTVRQAYDAAWRDAETQGAFDQLFFNTDGQLTEGARSNVFVKLAGQWCTPPLSCGLLPGIMRSVLMNDFAWNAIECSLSVEDLHNADAIVLCNSLRGVMPAILI